MRYVMEIVTMRKLWSKSRHALSQMGWISRVVLLVVGVYLLAALGVGMWWSSTPDLFDVKAQARQEVGIGQDTQLRQGVTTTATLVHLIDSLLDKPGGYLRNDVFPPGLWLDNMPAWEYGVLVQARDMARAMRRDISRSQTQSTEDKALSDAESLLFVNASAWMFPSAEQEYSKARQDLRDYLVRLQDDDPQNARFYARADNLERWLADVGTRLGSLSQRLAASVGQSRINIALANDRSATSSKQEPDEVMVKTSWSEIDDVFYEARGTAWALIHLLKAVEQDFGSVLDDKNARVSLRQIIRELESTQQPLGSPIILNGSGFGIFANHSLVMASYLARANAALIDLQELLNRG